MELISAEHEASIELQGFEDISVFVIEEGPFMDCSDLILDASKASCSTLETQEGLHCRV